jgi:lysozyme family protein
VADAERAIEKLLALEGSEYVEADVEAGPARYGLTTRWLRAAGLQDDPRGITRERAAEIYRRYWWQPLMLDSINDQAVAEALLITAVNVGAERCMRWWQSALRAAGEALRVDGRMGPQTIAATNRSGRAALGAFRAAVERFYQALAAREKYARYARGWERRVRAAFGEEAC